VNGPTAAEMPRRELGIKSQMANGKWEMKQECNKEQTMFARDRDLVVLEPGLFGELGWLAQRLVAGEGDVAGGTLALTALDVDFEAAGVEAGHLVILGEEHEATVYEVLERLSPLEVALSRLRQSPDSPPIAVPALSDARVEVWTFHPQIALAHAQLMRMVGIEPGQGAHGGAPSDIVNASAIRDLEAIAALYLIHAAAAGPEPLHSRSSAKAAHYRRLFAAQRERTPVLLDLDGDGQVDATRRFNVIQFLR
jgi:hypothetical protein